MSCNDDFKSSELQWQSAWRLRKAFSAPSASGTPKFYNFDSGPFPSGPLHLGHIRTHVLGDVTARFQRLLGKSVLYSTEWDAFGLPNELGAIHAGVSPAEFTAHNIQSMRRGMERIGISYDWSRVHSTCDPNYYRWTQWIFLALFRRGLAYRRRADVPWCDRCQSSLDRLQTIGDECWRCHSPVSLRSSLGWYIRLSAKSDFLLNGIELLSGWSSTGRNLLYRGLNVTLDREGVRAVADWPVSRQRRWGTPIPIVYCNRCGTVPDDQLPVELPSGLHESTGNVINDYQKWLQVRCPRCRGDATRESETLDCFFDDSWSFLSCSETLSVSDSAFPGNEMARWMPVDRFHSGFDTFAYLNLYRFMGSVFPSSVNGVSEPIASYMGHDMVLSDGQKMSKHLGNVVSPAELQDEYGADGLRVTILWAGAPERSIEWKHVDFGRTKKLFSRISRLVTKAAPMAQEAHAPCSGLLNYRWNRIARFIDEYRPNAAIEELSLALRQLESLAESDPRPGVRGRPTNLAKNCHDFLIALSPFAPHLAEELNQRMFGSEALIAMERWPSGHLSEE